MKSFLVFLVVIVVIGIVWAVKPIVNDRTRDHEQRLVASLNLVEEAISSSSTDILGVDLFSPEIARLSGDGRWQVSGILETQNRLGKTIVVRYVAAVAFSCTPYGNADCGKIESLSIEGRPLVVDNAVVAELQSVLSTTTDALGEIPPGANGSGAASLPAPQLDAAVPEPAPEPAAEVPTSQTPKIATTAVAPAPVATPAPVPVSDNEPVQGDRQIFLIQKTLRQLGYDPGPVDGQVGPRTTSAIKTYQRQANLPADGKPSTALLEHITHAAE